MGGPVKIYLCVLERSQLRYKRRHLFDSPYQSELYNKEMPHFIGFGF